MDRDIINLTIIISAKDEAGNVAELFEKIDLAFSELSIIGELIFIEDGSSDNTWETALNLKNKYSWLNLSKNRKNLGITKSFMKGFELVRGEFIIILPADLESDPAEDIPKLYNKLLEGHDVVAGWRQNRGDGKNLASWVYNKIANWLFGIDVHDKNWIKGFKAEVVRGLLLRSDWHRYLLMIFSHKGYKIAEVQTNWYPRKYGKSKYGFMRFPISIVDLLVLKFVMKYQEKPMMLFGSVGAIMILFGFSVIGYWSVYFIIHEIEFYLRPSIMLSLIIIILGVFFFFTGFLAELITGNQESINYIKRKLNTK